MHRPRPRSLASGLLAAVLLAAVLLAACGGATATIAPGQASSAASGSGSATQAPGGAATQVPAGGPVTQSPAGGAATQAPAGPASVDDACTLLTDDEIQQATGFRPIRRTPTTAPGDLPVGCEWELDNPDEFPWAIVIGLRSPGGRAIYDAFVASPVQAGEPVEGVGDDAQQNEDAAVQAVKGDTMISVTWLEFPPRAEVTRELARLALEGI